MNLLIDINDLELINNDGLMISASIGDQLLLIVNLQS